MGRTARNDSSSGHWQGGGLLSWLPWFSALDELRVLYLSWPVERGSLRPLVPAGLEIEGFEGSPWVSLVSLRINRLRGRFLPPIPGLDSLLEVGVRTNVSYRGQQGIHYLRLHGDNRPYMWLARTFFHINYVRATLKEGLVEPNGFFFESSRVGGGRYAVSWEPTGPFVNPEPGSLESFITNRYVIYTASNAGKLYHGRVEHAPWELCPIKADVSANTLFQAAGLPAPRGQPHASFSMGTHERAWPLIPVGW